MPSIAGRVLVTGGAGFIGSHIVDAALAAGMTVGIIDNLSTGKERNLHPQARFYHVDITKADEVDTAFADFRPDYVVHHAAQIDVRRSVNDPVHDAAVNILGTLNILAAARQQQVRKITYASSAALYGDPAYLPVDEKHPVQPLAPYGASKHTVEHYLEIYRVLYGLPYVALRYANVYGPRQDSKGEGGVVAIFTDRMLAGQEIVIFGDGEQTRDFVYVGDIARANLLALASTEVGICNISGQSEISVNGLFHLMSEVSGIQVRCTHVPERPGEIRRSILANGKAQTMLSWRPEVTLRAGLQQTFASQRAGGR